MLEFFLNIGHFIETYGFSIIIGFLVVLGLYVRIKDIISGNIVEWLVDKVGDAEAYFGSETGQLKLRSVYNTFVSQRPILAIFISFKTFSVLVDAALEKFEDMIENNEKIKEWYEKKKAEIESKKDKIEDIEESNNEEIKNEQENNIQVNDSEEYGEEIVPDVDNLLNEYNKKIIEKFTLKKSE